MQLTFDTFVTTYIFFVYHPFCSQYLQFAISFYLFPKTASSFLRRDSGDGVRRLFSRRHRRIAVPRTAHHAEHHAHHPGQSLVRRAAADRGHETLEETLGRQKHPLHHEQQLHDRLLLQNPLSTGLSALQHHLLVHLLLKMLC